MSGNQARNWCFTINNYTDEDVDNLITLDVDFLIFAFEEGKNGVPHIQGYLQINRIRRTALSKLIPRACLIIANGSAEENIRYISGPYKKGRKVKPVNPDCYIFPDEDSTYTSKGGNNISKGSQNDFSALRDSIKNGASYEDVIDNFPSLAFRYERAIKEYITSNNAKNMNDRKLEVTVLVGKPGVGKTSYVMNKYDRHDIFILQPRDPLWWDGYNGQDVLLIDDFYGTIDHDMMLKILDIYPLSLNIKGGTTYARWTKVFITSNDSPTEWWPGGLELNLHRRIHNYYIVERKNNQAKLINFIPVVNNFHENYVGDGVGSVASPEGAVVYDGDDIIITNGVPHKKKTKHSKKNIILTVD